MPFNNPISGGRVGYGITGFGIGGPIGAAFGYGLGSSMDNIESQYGGDWGAYAKDTLLNPLGIGATSAGDAIGRILDPGGVFYSSKKKNKKKAEMKKYKSELVGDKFDERQQGYLDQLLRTLATLGAQQNNRATEFAARNDLPEGSAAALQRGVDYQTLLAGREGSVDLSRQADLQRQKNIQFLMALQAEKDADKRREMMAQWQSASNILGTIGQIAGSYYGSKTAKTTGG